MKFIETLSEMLDFTYTIHPLGADIPTNDGIGMVANGSFDMLASWITITEERSSYVSFTYPFFDVGVRFVYLKNTVTKLNLFKAFTPFQVDLWLAIGGCLLITVFLMWVFEGAKNDQLTTQTWGSGRRAFGSGMIRSVYVISSLMLGQLIHKPETLEGYILTLGWLFAVFLLSASFTAELASFLTVNKMFVPTITINSFRSGEVPHSKVALKQGGNLQTFYEREVINCSGEACLDRDDTPQPCFSVEECLGKVMNGEVLTTLMDSATAEYLTLTEYCQLGVLDGLLNPQHYGLVLPLDSPLVPEFMMATLHLRESGALTSIADEFLFETSCPDQDQVDGLSPNMSIHDAGGVFIMLGLIFLLTTIIWLCRRSPMAKARRQRSEKNSTLSVAFPPSRRISSSFHKRSLDADPDDSLEGAEDKREEGPTFVRKLIKKEGIHQRVGRGLSKRTRVGPVPRTQKQVETVPPVNETGTSSGVNDPIKRLRDANSTLGTRDGDSGTATSLKISENLGVGCDEGRGKEAEQNKAWAGGE
ncbi:unnamed protein product [Choristocarpus tenellus]